FTALDHRLVDRRGAGSATGGWHSSSGSGRTRGGGACPAQAPSRPPTVPLLRFVGYGAQERLRLHRVQGVGVLSVLPAAIRAVQANLTLRDPELRRDAGIHLSSSPQAPRSMKPPSPP